MALGQSSGLAPGGALTESAAPCGSRASAKGPHRAHLSPATRQFLPVVYHLLPRLRAGSRARLARAVSRLFRREDRRSACDERQQIQLTAGGGPANRGGGASASALMRGRP